MPIPNHQPKLESAPLVTPEQSLDDHHGPPLPSTVILCYSRRLYEYVTDNYDGTPIDRYYGDLYTIDEDIGILGNFGIGAPITALLMEELIADDVTTFLSIGYAGSLDPTIDFGEYILCDKAIRDEGTSYHYRKPTSYAYPSPTLFESLEASLADRDDAYHVGPSWTIDAVYRETEAEIEHYTDAGVLTVEMEAAAVFTVAAHHDVDAAAMFVVSDYLTPTDWTPDFENAVEDLYHLADTAIDLLPTNNP